MFSLYQCVFHVSFFPWPFVLMFIQIRWLADCLTRLLESGHCLCLSLSLESRRAESRLQQEGSPRWRSSAPQPALELELFPRRIESQNPVWVRWLVATLFGFRFYFFLHFSLACVQLVKNKNMNEISLDEGDIVDSAWCFP